MPQAKITIEFLDRACREAREIVKETLAREQNPTMPKWIDQLICLLELTKRDALEQEDCEMIAFASCWIHRIHCLVQDFEEAASKQEQEMMISIRQLGDGYRAYPSIGSQFGGKTHWDSPLCQSGGRSEKKDLYFVENKTCPHAQNLRRTFEKYQDQIDRKYRVIHLDIDNSADRERASQMIMDAGGDPRTMGVPLLLVEGKAPRVGSAQGANEKELLRWLGLA